MCGFKAIYLDFEIIFSNLDHFWRRQWHPTPVLLPGKSHGQRSLVGCSPWSRQESDTTERLHFHFSLAYIGEGNGSPLQCSCLENPGDRGAWWAAVYGVTQSQTRLKRLSSSSVQVQVFTDWQLPCLPLEMFPPGALICHIRSLIILTTMLGVRAQLLLLIVKAESIFPVLLDKVSDM